MGYKFKYDFSKEAERWRAAADYWDISPEAKKRLEWIIFYHEVAGKDATHTATYFGISRKTFHKWLKRFNPSRMQSLEEESRRPHQLRQWQVTKEEEERVVILRKTYMQYGKAKLKLLYQRHYGALISTWKIERVIREHHLFPDLKAHKKLVKKRHQSREKIRITQVNTGNYQAGTLWHTDAVVLYWYGTYRIIFTGIEDKTKLAFARAYTTHSSRNAADFLKRLVYLSDSSITVMHSDNGGEFAGEFEKACKDLSIQQIYSRVRQPKDNPALERFNRTLQEEWLNFSEVGLDEITEANRDLTNWLIEYNFNRPHQALDYLTPIEYAQHNYFNVLPMYPARTWA